MNEESDTVRINNQPVWEMTSLHLHLECLIIVLYIHTKLVEQLSSSYLDTQGYMRTERARMSVSHNIQSVAEHF